MAKKPSSWVNLQDYLAVNEDQGQGMANKVAGNVSAVADKAQADVKTAADTVARDAAAGAAKDNTTAAPTTSAEAKARAAAATYSGPEGLDAVDPTLAGQVGDAVSRVAQAGESGGQQAILGQEYKGGGSSGAGGGALDSFLLSGAGGGETMRGVQSKYGQLGSQYVDQQDRAERNVEGGKAAVAKNKAAWSSLEQTLLGNENEAAAKAQQAKDDADFDAKWQGAMAADAGDNMNAGFDTFNQVMSPFNQLMTATGNRDPIHDWGKSVLNPLINKNAGVASGSTRGQKIWWQPRHKEVYRQMDPAQWQQLNSLPQSAQAQWMDQRMMELGRGQAYSPGNYNFAGDKSNAFYGVGQGNQRAKPKG